MPAMRKRAWAVVFALLLAACATARQGPHPMLQAQLAALKVRLFELVEEERMQAGAKPLVLDPERVVAAQAHSDDMARKRSFDTMNPNGNLALNTLLSTDPKFIGFFAENSAAQYFTPSLGIDPDAMAKGFLEIWLGSPTHRSNLTYKDFDRTGIGIAVNGNAIYVSEVFTSDLGLPEPH